VENSNSFGLDTGRRPGSPPAERASIGSVVGSAGAATGRRGALLGLLACTFAAALLLASCAYYNTFYFARKYYNQAIRAGQNTGTGKTPLLPARKTGVAHQVSSLLDRSIEKCAKVISFYPKSKWVDDAIFLMGECYYHKQEYDKAMKKFNDLGIYYPKSELVPNSVVMMGMCHFGRSEYDQSIQVLTRALRDYPRLSAEQRDLAQFTIGEALFEKKRFTEALPNYRRLAGTRHRTEIHFASLLRMGECYFELAAYDSALMGLSVVVESSRDDAQILEALTKMGDARRAQGDSEEAIGIYERALELTDNPAKAPVLRLRIADAVAAMADYQRAIELYRVAVEASPRTLYAAEAQFRIGYISEIHLEDLDAAAQAYERVKEQAPRSEFASQAELRRKGLARLKESGAKPDATEADKAAESGFLLAELSLFQLDKPDKAVERYLSVERDYPSSIYAPKSAYAVAYIYLYVKHDTLATIETCRRIIGSFSRTEYASAAADILTSLNVELPAGYEPVAPEPESRLPAQSQLPPQAEAQLPQDETPEAAAESSPEAVPDELEDGAGRTEQSDDAESREDGAEEGHE
jgi:TolA-binding protein